MRRYAVLMCLLLLSGISSANEDEVQAGIFRTYLKLAEEGDMNAQYIVAHRYEIGKGTGADPEKANYWYDRAAAKGHPLALRKVEERHPPGDVPEVETARPHALADMPAAKPAEPPAAPKPPAAAPPVKVSKVLAKAQEPKAKSAPTPSARAEKSNGAAPPAQSAADSKAKEVQQVAKAAAEPPAPINMVAAVLGGQWSRQRQPAEVLPSTLAACLQSSRAEIVCFSSELSRNVGGAGVSYNVKSTLSGLDGRDGRFALSYVYNVLHVASRPDSQALPSDGDDLQARTGWQEPGHRLECRFNDERAISCTHADRRLTYQFARD